MKTSALVTAGFTLASIVTAQNVTVPDTCTSGFESGTDEVIYTVPYTYDQVMSIIGSYKNLTWSGNPDDTVTLNGTDNMVGTARTYDLAGAHVIETILVYNKPAAPGPYEEIHNVALLTVPSYNLSVYIPYDGTVVSSECDGKAAKFNFTANFCASNASVAAQVLHTLHMTDAMTVGQFLGGQNFTSCEALNSTGTGSGSNTSYPTYTASFTQTPEITAVHATGTGAATTSGSSSDAAFYQPSRISFVVAILVGLAFM